MAGKTYQVDSKGNAPTGATTGDFVKTAGGTYEVLDGKQYSGLSKEQLATAGVGFNPNTGLYSKKVSAPTNQGYGATTVDFDVDAWKNEFINNSVGKLQANYNNDLSSMKKTYGQNVDTYEGQIDDVNEQYEGAVQDLSKQAYINNVMAKQQASSQGLTSSAQGIALSQSALNNANEQSTSLFKSRDRSISSINGALNALKANFNIDKDTLNANFSAGKLSAMSDAELSALEKQLQIATSNAGIKNDWDMAKYSTENSNAQAEKDRALQTYLTKLQINATSANANAKASKLDPKYETAMADQFRSKLAEGWDSNLTDLQRDNIEKAYISVQYGLLSSDDFKKMIGDYTKSATPISVDTGNGFWDMLTNTNVQKANSRTNRL